MARVNVFYANEPDNLHCLQNSFRMVYETIFGRSLSVEQAEILTNFELGVPTWPFKILKSCADLGLEVKHYEVFDPEFFVLSPEQAIRNLFDNEKIAQQVINHTDISSERQLVEACLHSEMVEFIVKTPTISDIVDLLNEGYFVICNVNSPTLVGKDDYAGHFIIVESVGDDGNLLIQNPGLPPIKDQIVSLDLFNKAFHYPNPESGNIIAIRKLNC